LAGHAAARANPAQYGGFACDHRRGCGNANAAGQRPVDRPQSQQSNARAGDLACGAGGSIVLRVVPVPSTLGGHSSPPGGAHVFALRRVVQGPAARVDPISQPQRQGVLRASRCGAHFAKRARKRRSTGRVNCTAENRLTASPIAGFPLLIFYRFPLAPPTR
jgi:hypothetical protein